MRFMLDTNICVYLIRGRSTKLLQTLANQAISDISVSAITVAELQFGVSKSRQQAQNQQALNQFILPLTVLDFDYDATILYGQIRAHLEAQGTPIGSLDTLIAAHALSKNLTLITNNTKEFSLFPGLAIDDWS